MGKVLVVDDEPYILLMIKKMLEQSGHEVDLASNGKEGLEMLNNKPFDILITDIVMPEKEGLETIREVRHKYPELKIIAISGGGRLDSNEYLEPARLFGAKRIIKKPFQKAEIINAVNELLQKG